MENCYSSEKSRFLPIHVPSLCWQLTCYKRTTQLVPLPAANCPGLPGPSPGHDLCPVHRDSLCAQGARTLSKHCHMPGLISLFLPTLLLPAVSSPCSQKAKKPAASISAAAPQSLFVINFTKGLGSPAPFHVPDSGEIMTVSIDKALSGGISAPWYVHVRVHMCLWSHVYMKERQTPQHSQKLTGKALMLFRSWTGLKWYFYLSIIYSITGSFLCALDIRDIDVIHTYDFCPQGTYHQIYTWNLHVEMTMQVVNSMKKLSEHKEKTSPSVLGGIEKLPENHQKLRI